MQAMSRVLILLLTMSSISHAENFAKDFAVRVEKWVKDSNDSSFKPLLVVDKTITLAFDHSSVIIEFDGFTLDIASYTGIDNSSLTIEQNLSKPNHPFNDPVVGISRNHFSIKDPNNTNHLSYINYYVNIDENTKYRIRLWDIL